MPAVSAAAWRLRVKIIRWPVAAATAYVIYKYTIGKKDRGEDVFASPEGEAAGKAQRKEGSATRPKKPRARKAP